MMPIRRYAERNGRKAMFAFNITGEIDEMLERHDIVRREGGSCVMVSLNWVGTVGLARLRRHATLPIHGHRNGWGFFSRCPALGFEFKAWHKLHRLAGADHIHVNGLRNKFSEPDELVIASARACLAPLFADHPDPLPVMPVFSSGQTVWQAADTFSAVGTVDLIHAAGGGIMAHPGELPPAWRRFAKLGRPRSPACRSGTSRALTWSLGRRWRSSQSERLIARGQGSAATARAVGNR